MFCDILQYTVYVYIVFHFHPTRARFIYYDREGSERETTKKRKILLLFLFQQRQQKQRRAPIQIHHRDTSDRFKSGDDHTSGR